MENKLVFTPLELHHYRSLVGLQLSYAQKGDSHKVAELQRELMAWVTRLATRLIKERTGQVVDLRWSLDGESQYVTMVAESFGVTTMEEWKRKQMEIERWVSGYIEQALLQASLPVLKMDQKN